MATEEDKFQEGASGESDNGGGQASRARNRTVMLTPEITGEVRARLAQDMAAEPQAAPEPATRAPVEPAFGGRSSHTAPVAPRGAAEVAGGFESPVPRTAPSAGMAPVAESASPNAYRIRQGVIWSKPSRVTGFLVSYDDDENGEVFELRMGRLIVTSEAPGAGNYLVLDNETVSSMHAIIRMSKFGEIQILDQLSEYGTRIIRGDSGKEEDLSGDKSILHHGDTVFFGDRKFSICLVPNEEE
ncbi:MAG: FHA domain-containing protein [Bdellovibrionales bacterium]|nr:FHA domain-containing protein [Bdellovibrionales bacterium]